MSEDRKEKRNDYTDSEWDEIWNLVDQLPSEFFGSRGAAWEDSVLRLAELVRVARERRRTENAGRLMTKEQAVKWYKEIQGGNGVNREEHREQFGIGELAERLWNDADFTYGIEYGVLIAIAKIFDLSPEDL